MEHYIQDMFTSCYRRNPGKEAIYDYDAGVRYTWTDLHVRAVQLSRFCTNELSLKKGDRVAFLCPTDVAMINMLHVSLKTGLIIVAYNYRLMAADLAALMDEETPSVVFFSSDVKEKLAETASLTSASFKTVCLDGESPADYSFFEIFETEYPPTRIVELDPEDPALLVHTGGTTGLPKAAVISYRNIFLNMVIEMKEMGICKEDVIYSVMPFFHTGGWNTFSLVVLFAGGRIILSRAFSPDAFYTALKEERLTAFMGVELMFRLIARDSRFDTANIEQLKYVIAGGSPIEKSLMMKYMDRGVSFYNGYGSTESGANNSSISFDTPLEIAKDKYDSIGRPFVFNYYRIVNKDGNEVEQGEQGELITRGGVLFSGYWHNEEATKEAMQDGWFHTGDMAYVDENGDYHICGRLKQMYISGGENVYPPEIERAIQEYPDIKECHVMGVPDAQWGEVGKAYLVLDSGKQLDEVDFESFLKARLPTIKRPHYVLVVPEIPKTIMGKVDDVQIEKLYENK